MKHIAGVAVAALALVVVGAAILRVGRSASPEDSRSGAAPTPERAFAAASSPREGPAPSVETAFSSPYKEGTPSHAASRITWVATRIARKLEANRVSGIPPTPQEQAEIGRLEETLTRQGMELAEQLRNEPAAWPGVIDLLGSMEDRNAAFRAVGALSSAMDVSGERTFTESLRGGAGPNGRLVAIHALSGRDSSDSLTALLSAAEGDPDPRVRLAALKALVQRRQRIPGGSDMAITVEDAVRRRSQVDESAEIRALAAKLLPGVQPQPPSQPPPARKSPLGRRPGSP